MVRRRVVDDVLDLRRGAAAETARSTLRCRLRSVLSTAAMSLAPDSTGLTSTWRL
jgi:hypothetical protein